MLVQSDPDAAARLLAAAQAHVHEQWKHLQRAAWTPTRVEADKDAAAGVTPTAPAAAKTPTNPEEKK